MDNETKETKTVSLFDVKDAEKREEWAGKFMEDTQVRNLPKPIIDRAITEYNQAMKDTEETKRQYHDPEFNKTPQFIKNILVKNDFGKDDK